MAAIETPSRTSSGRQAVLKVTGGLVFGAVVWVLLTTLTEVSRPMVTVATVAAVFLIAVDRDVWSWLVGAGRELRAERTLQPVFAGLPAGWRVFHDLDVGGEVVPHAVIGRGGAFAVSLAPQGKKAVAEGWGLVIDGSQSERATVDAHRLSHRLGQVLRLEVEPVILFIGPVVGERADRVRVLQAQRLVRFLETQPQVLSFEEARSAWSRAAAVSRR